MLLLVLADWHMRGAIEQDIRRHQHRIVVESDGRVLAVLAGLLLELRHPAQPADARDTVEDPGQLGVSGDLALVEDDVLLRIDAARNERRGDLAGIARKLCRAAPYVHALRDRVQVDDAIEAAVVLLQLDEIDDRAEVIAEMQIAGRLDARKNPFNHRHGQCSRFACLQISRRRLPRAPRARKSPGLAGLRALTVSRQPVTPNRLNSRP